MSSFELPIEVRDLVFAYGTGTALDHVDLEVRRGEIVGLLGPNGSGKSTLVRIVSGVLPEYRGTARLFGDEVRHTPARERARRLAVVPQEVTFGFPFTALEIVLMGRHPHVSGLAFESRADVEQAREVLRRCGASDLADREIHRLSSGERQRIVFARALAQTPECLILDEPASFMDIRHRVELYDLVREMTEVSNAAVLTVLHDLNLAAEYCDRIVLLKEGRVLAAGRTEETFTYANLTRAFDTDIYVDTNDLTGRLLAVPLSGRVQQGLDR
jgi:iron complex transport system ATP-binding protein